MTIEDPPTGPVQGTLPRPGAFTFSPGETVAGRYRILRFIAQGGMGEVYEAEDAALGERVALKTIRPGVADARAEERFRREILLARKVTHPNVCRIFDIGHHPQAGGGALLFLTMELLAGETLAARLRRTGRMAWSEARGLGEQMAAALAAAHKEGIVHRDFKSANVLLVPWADGHSPPRAVVTDFGLARAAARSLSDDDTATGFVAGTPAYMAPEQVESGEISPRIDVYALGVVLYEMATGRQPFAGDSPLATAVKRLKQDPVPPRAHVPDIDPLWEGAILGCLERDPARRLQTGDDVARALRGDARRRRSTTGRRLLWAALALAVGLAALQLPRFRATPPSAVPPAGAPGAPLQMRRSVAVLGFRNLSGRPQGAWLSTALSEMLATELAAGESLRTVPGENVARMKTDLSLADSDSLARDSLARIRSHLGADVVVLGSYLALGADAGGKLRLDLRIQDAVEGETLASLADTGTEAELFELVARIGVRLRETLGVAGDSAAAAARARAALPTGPEAARLYAEGLTRLRLFDARAAKDLLEGAVRADPRSPLAHAALSAAWTGLGYDGRARDEARRAYDLASELSREDRLAVEGRYRETTREWDKAIGIYRTLFGFFPDDIEYGLRLALAQSQAAKGKDALATVEALRQLPPPARDDPRVDHAEAVAHSVLSDFKRELAAAERTISKAKASGLRLVSARGSILRGWASLNLGQTEAAIASFDDARRVFADAGARVDEANAVGNSGYPIYLRGDHAGALARMREALEIYREIGHRRGQAVNLQNMAPILLDEGDLAGARKSSEAAVVIYREIGDRKSAAMILNNLALTSLLQGDLVRARRLYDESKAALEEMGVRSEVARVLINIATLLRRHGDLAAARGAADAALATWRETSADKRLEVYILFDRGGLLAAGGDLAGARESYDEALAICRETGNKTYTAYVLAGLGELLVAQGDLASARKSHEEALALRRGLGERSYAAESQAALAVVTLEEGHAAEAETAAREAVAEFVREGRRGSNTLEVGTEAGAREVLARALVAQAKGPEARAEVARARALLVRSPSRFVALAAGLTDARGWGAAAPREAQARLQTLEADARGAGFLGLELEARLAWARSRCGRGARRPAAPGWRPSSRTRERRASASSHARRLPRGVDSARPCCHTVSAMSGCPSL